MGYRGAAAAAAEKAEDGIIMNVPREKKKVKIYEKKKRRKKMNGQLNGKTVRESRTGAVVVAARRLSLLSFVEIQLLNDKRRREHAIYREMAEAKENMFTYTLGEARQTVVAQQLIADATEKEEWKSIKWERFKMA